MNPSAFHCRYKINVPKGRRITVEMIKGESIVESCASLAELSHDMHKERFLVSLIFFYIVPLNNNYY